MQTALKQPRLQKNMGYRQNGANRAKNHHKGLREIKQKKLLNFFAPEISLDKREKNEF